MSHDNLVDRWAKALGGDRRQFNMFFEQMIDGFAYHKIIVDKAGKPVDYVFLEANRSFEEMTGLNRVQIIGKKVTEALPGIEKDPADWIGIYGHVALTGKPVQFENYAKPLGKWFKVSAYCPEKGYFATIFEDITDRKKAEESLHENEALLQSFFESPGIMRGIVEVVNESDIRHIKDNEVTASYVGLTPKDLEGKLSSELGEPRERIEVWLKNYKQSQQSNKPTRFEYVDKNGLKETWMSSTVMYLGTASNGNPRFTYVVSDVTEIKRVEEALSESERLWSTTLSSIGDAVIATDLGGNILFMNGVAEELTGWKLGEAYQKPLTQVFKIINETTRLSVEDPVAKVLEKGLVVGLANHTILVRKDGSDLQIDDSGAPIKTRDGWTTGVVLVFRDITERRKMEEEVRSIAKFPSENPYPILRIREDGTILYSNPACTPIIGEQLCSVGHLAPQRWQQLVLDVLHSGEPRQVDETYSDKTFSYAFIPITDSGYVNVYGRDITERIIAEEALRESEQRFRSIVETSPVLISVSSVSDGTILFTNPTYERVFGFAEGELIGRKAPDLYFDPADRKTLLDTLKKDGVVRNYEVKVKRKDGTPFWIASSISPILFHGKPAFIGASVDITERKRLEAKTVEYAKHLEELVEKRTEEISIERQRLYSVLETLPVYVILLDKDYHVPFANKFFRERFGESGGRCCFEYLFNRSESCENCETYKVMKTHAPHHWEWTGPDKRNYDIFDFPFIEADGSRMILEMGIDITEQKRAQQSLRSTSQYVRSLIEAAIDPLVTISAEGKITDVNEATVKVTGVSREEIIGTDFSNYFAEPEKAREGYQRVFTEGSVTNYPLTIRGKDGRLTDVLYNATVYRNEAGEVQGVFAAARDVTEYNELERKLKASERLATIGQTAGMVGHDMRNPLQAISGALYLIGEDVMSLPESVEKKEMGELLTSVEDSLDYIDKIVADLQDFVRPITPAIRKVAVKSLLEETLKGIKVPANIQVAVDVDGSLTAVRFDPDLMRRVFTNLATNAVQAMPSGGSLTVKVEKDGGDVLISFRDTGTGIPEDAKSKLFTPLFTTKSKGQGFGLVVCKRIVEAHKGEITFESQIGKGTTFTIRIPSKQ